MWTMPPAIMQNAGDAGLDLGELVVELLFEDGAGSGTAANTGTLGGVYTIGGPTGASITAADSYQGGGSLNGADVVNPQGGASTGVSAELIIGTANFSLEVAVKLTTLSTTFDQNFWGWESGSPSPILGVTSAGALVFTGVDTGVTVTTDVWHTYVLRRISGVTKVLYDGAEVYSVADTSNYNNGFTTGSFRVGCGGNFAAGIRNGFLDQFRFYNGNA